MGGSVDRLYVWAMSTGPLSVSQAGRQLAEVVDRVRQAGAPVYLERDGRVAAAVIGAEDLDRLIELATDMEDIRAAVAARRELVEADEAPIPWERVKLDLGLT